MNFIIFQVHLELVIAAHVWQDKRAAIAKTVTVDELAAKFRPACWMNWIHQEENLKTYPEGAVDFASALWQGILIVGTTREVEQILV